MSDVEIARLAREKRLEALAELLEYIESRPSLCAYLDGEDLVIQFRNAHVLPVVKTSNLKLSVPRRPSQLQAA